jgi:putative Mg2+ transporter-C (MgtC) family protein
MRPDREVKRWRPCWQELDRWPRHPYGKDVDPIQVVFGDLRQVMPRPYCEMVLVATAFLCGALVGFEREKEHKPAGLRTLILICVGSAIFTVVSASPALAGHEPARIAAQIVTGVGFLGAGSILRDRHHISGLTTAATIWACSGIGIMVGAGYAAAGVVLSAAVLVTLGWVRHLEFLLNGPCQVRRALVVYQPGQGKTRARITALLDDAKGHIVIGDDKQRPEGLREISIEYCGVHRDHRCVLAQLADVPGVEALEPIA